MTWRVQIEPLLPIIIGAQTARSPFTPQGGIASRPVGLLMQAVKSPKSPKHGSTESGCTRWIAPSQS